MPKNNSKGQGKGGNSQQSATKSSYAIHQSYGGSNNFMHSYGLKPWNHDDVQEGKAIVEAMKDADRQGGEGEQSGKK